MLRICCTSLLPNSRESKPAKLATLFFSVLLYWAVFQKAKRSLIISKVLWFIITVSFKTILGLHFGLILLIGSGSLSSRISDSQFLFGIWYCSFETFVDSVFFWDTTPGSNSASSCLGSNISNEIIPQKYCLNLEESQFFPAKN